MNSNTILIIDDDPSNIQVIINILQQNNESFKILSSSSSKLGLEIAELTVPDIIISDWQMPELNGIELIKELKLNEKTKEIPVIIATGIMMTSADLKLALDYGAYDFIRKPIEDNELIARVNSALKFVEYYRTKIEIEKKVINLEIDRAKAELDSHKKELISKTTMLLNINNLYQKFSDKISEMECEKNNLSCKVYNYAKLHSKEMISYTNNQIWNELEINFEQVNSDFFKKLSEQFPSLTTNERKLCAYLRMNMTTKDICSITLQSIRSIEIARTRLREKLNLKGSDEDLNQFLNHL